MAVRPLKVTEEMKQQIMSDFEKKLCDMLLFDGKGTYELPKYKIEDNGDPMKAIVHFTEVAWRKQKALISEFSSEVGWHGICKRDPENTSRFIVEDILVFPQEVTGATVTPDQAKYNQWVSSLDDNQFNNLRFHGHSHVNMGVTPSGTDNKYQQDRLDGLQGKDFKPEVQKEIVEALGDTNFYIFMIMNKSGAINARVFDMWDNVMYDDKDVVVEYEGDPIMDTFISEAKKLVTQHSYNYQYSSNPGFAKGGYYEKRPAAMSQNRPNTPAIPSHVDRQESIYDFAYGAYRDGHYD